MEPPNQQLAIDTARPNGALGPAYLVGALREVGIEADYYDGTVGWTEETLKHTFYNRSEQPYGTIRYGASPERIAEVVSGYDIVATSSIFTAQTRMHFEVANIAKKVGAESGRPSLVVSGGVNARALKEHFLSNGFDIIAMGDGERVIVEVAQRLAGKQLDMSQICGIAYRDGDKVVTTPPRRLEALDCTPYPCLEALPLDTYQRIGIPHSGVLPYGTKFGAIQTSRGCQDRCTFCHISYEKEHADTLGPIGYLRYFSIARVGQDVDRALGLGVTRLYFEDDNLFFNKKRVQLLMPSLKRTGLEYSNVNGGNIRFLFDRTSVDKEFIEVLAEIGLRELVLPFESRDFQIMKRYATGKYNPDTMDSKALVRALKESGIRISGNFMIGFPDEPWASVMRTKEFAKELIDEGMDAVGFMIPVPYPGSIDFQHCMDQGYRKTFDRDPLTFTDRMHWRMRPLFPTVVSGRRLEASVQEFWEELNPKEYVQHKLEQNIMRQT